MQSDLTEIERLKAEGVVFFGDLEECGQEPEKTKAEDTEAEDTGKETEQEAKEETLGTEDAQAFSCGGHDVSVCYGHRDLTVYVPVISMEEIFRGGEIPAARGR